MTNVPCSLGMCRCCGSMAESNDFLQFNRVEHVKRELVECWKIQISDGDGLPEHICQLCYKKVEDYLNFRQECIELQEQLNTQYKTFRNMMGRISIVKKACKENTQRTDNNLAPANKINIDNRLVITKLNEVSGMENNENTKKKPNIFPQETIKILVNNADNIVKNVNTVEKQTLNVTAKDAVEFVIFPDVTYSKATLSQTYMKDVIKHKNDRNNDPLDETDIDLIITESVQHVKKSKLIEEISETMLSAEETATEIDIFPDETSQSTNDVSETPEVEWEKPNQIIEQLDRNHLFKDINEERNQKCKFCISNSEEPFLNDINYPTKAKLIEHIIYIHNPKLPYQCHICRVRKFSTRQRCVYHIIHAHKQNGNICLECGIGPGSYNSFEGHRKRYHSFGDYECETCEKKFENISLEKFEYHKRWHNANRQLQCSYCAKIFVQRIHLRAHEMIHTKNYELKCEICGKGFRTHLNKALHKHKVHDAEKPVKCLYCDKRFKCYSSRFHHMKKIHGYIPNTSSENVRCSKCKKLFRRETNYRRHLQTDCLNIKHKKSFQQPDKKFPCDQCSCRFRTEPGLKQHIVLHSKEGRPFECHICHLNYKSSSNLETHHKVKHNPNKPYQCDICGKGFPEKYILNGHRKFHKIN